MKRNKWLQIFKSPSELGHNKVLFGASSSSPYDSHKWYLCGVTFLSWQEVSLKCALDRLCTPGTGTYTMQREPLKLAGTQRVDHLGSCCRMCHQTNGSVHVPVEMVGTNTQTWVNTMPDEGILLVDQPTSFHSGLSCFETCSRQSSDSLEDSMSRIDLSQDAGQTTLFANFIQHVVCIPGYIYILGGHHTGGDTRIKKMWLNKRKKVVSFFSEKKGDTISGRHEWHHP